MKNQKISKENIIIISAAIILSIAIISFAIISNSSKNIVPGKFDKFAQCLTEKGAIMYGAAWCPHCQAQKAAFGDSFKYIKYVECPDNTQLCIDKGVQAFPTWLIGTSTKFEGFDENKTMNELASSTSCQLP